MKYKGVDNLRPIEIAISESRKHVPATSKDLSKWIKILRDKYGMTIKEISNKTGFSERKVRKYLNE